MVDSNIFLFYFCPRIRAGRLGLMGSPAPSTTTNRPRVREMRGEHAGGAWLYVCSSYWENSYVSRPRRDLTNAGQQPSSHEFFHRGSFDWAAHGIADTKKRRRTDAAPTGRNETVDTSILSLTTKYVSVLCFLCPPSPPILKPSPRERKWDGECTGNRGVKEFPSDN